MTMLCLCGGRTEVVETRRRGVRGMMRRRQCKGCRKRFVTYEAVDLYEQRLQVENELVAYKEKMRLANEALGRAIEALNE
jgi:transcriptional regulator NrdR family protein